MSFFFKLSKNLIARLLFLSILSFQAFAVEVNKPLPLLRFSDVINGPSTGLGDGLGSGIVVTLWGQHLGTGANSSVFFEDSSGKSHEAAHVYYWKNADGQKPSGPSNLYASHKMQEIAFSIPESAPGAGSIYVSVNGVISNQLQFSVRDGGIYHVRSSGDDTTGDGSFSAPWQTIEGAMVNLKDSPGSSVFVHDSIISGGVGSVYGVYWNDANASSTQSNHFGFLAYPGSQPEAIGDTGFGNYLAKGQVVSKFLVKASHNECTEDANHQPDCIGTKLTIGIRGTDFGRIVGNAITDIPGYCANGQQGAISANALGGERVSFLQILGNEIYEYGCFGSTKFHHTTYLSVRNSDNLEVGPWRFGWNYLHDNYTKNGIHMHDQLLNGACGTPTGTIVVNDNVIVNQAGSGIHVGASCNWQNDFKIYNNLLINVGLVSSWDGIDPMTSDGPNTPGISVSDLGLSGNMAIYNNTIYKWNDDDWDLGVKSCIGLTASGGFLKTFTISENVCFTDKDKPFVATIFGKEAQMDDLLGSLNAWYSSSDNPVYAITPKFDTAPVLGAPSIVLNQNYVTLSRDSALLGKSNDSVAPLTHDIYGFPRGSEKEIGAVEYFVYPNPPSNLRLQ